MEFTDPPGLATRYAVKEPTVRAWVRLTDIPVVRVGRLIRFKVADVDAWLLAGGASKLAPALRAEAMRSKKAPSNSTEAIEPPSQVAAVGR